MLPIKYFHYFVIGVLSLLLLALTLFSILYFATVSYDSLNVWFKENIDSDKYTLECKMGDGVNPDEYLRIYDSDGEVIYDMSFHLRSDYHHGRYTYKVEHEDEYIKLVFINENNVLCQAYRFYYDDLDELAKIKEK